MHTGVHRISTTCIHRNILRFILSTVMYKLSYGNLVVPDSIFINSSVMLLCIIARNGAAIFTLLILRKLIYSPNIFSQLYNCPATSLSVSHLQYSRHCLFAFSDRTTVVQLSSKAIIISASFRHRSAKRQSFCVPNLYYTPLSFTSPVELLQLIQVFALSTNLPYTY